MSTEEKKWTGLNTTDVPEWRDLSRRQRHLANLLSKRLFGLRDGFNEEERDYASRYIAIEVDAICTVHDTETLP